MKWYTFRIKQQQQNKRDVLFFMICFLFACIRGMEYWIAYFTGDHDGKITTPLLLSALYVVYASLILAGVINIINREKTWRIITQIPKRFPFLTNLMMGIVSCISLICLLEFCFYLLYSHAIPHSPQRENAGTYTEGYFQKDELLGYKPKASAEISSILIEDKKTLYNVIYSIDMYHRRMTPAIQRESRTKFALFFGCSYTFGEGVENNETFPYYFSEFALEYMPYNYGFHGYGPQEMLAKLQYNSLTKEIKEIQGIGIYLYLPDTHEQRAIGNMSVFNGWGKNMPFYTFDFHRNLMRKGSFSSGRPVISYLYSLLGQSYVIKYFGIQFPSKLTEKHYRLTAKIIEEAKNEFNKKFMSDHFYVIIYPNTTRKNIIPYLQKAGIIYFDYSDLFDSSLEQYNIIGDGHPSSEAYKILAKKLSEDIANLNQ